MEKGMGGSSMNETLMTNVVGPNNAFGDLSMNMSMRQLQGTII